MPRPEPTLSPEDVLEVRTILDAAISGSGAYVVYSVTSAAADRSADTAQLFLVDVAAGVTRPLTEPGSFDLAPVWCLDGTTVSYLSARSGVLQLWRVGLDGAEPRQLTELEAGVGATSPVVSPDGLQVAFTAAVRPPRDPSAPYRVRHALWRVDGMGLVEDLIQEVHLVGVHGGEPRQLSDDAGVVMSMEWSPGGDRLMAVVLDPGEDPRYVIRVYDVATGRVDVVWEGPFLLYPPAAAWMPDGRIVRTGANTLGMGEPVELVVDSSTGGTGSGADAETHTGPGTSTVRMTGWLFGILQGDFPFMRFLTPRIVVPESGDEAYVGVQDGGSVNIHGVGLHGAPAVRLVWPGEHCAVPYGSSADHILVGVSTLHEPPDLWLVHRRDGTRRRLTTLNERFSPGAFFEVSRLEVTGGDGQDVEAWFLAPAGGDGGHGPVRTVVENHGGPHAAWGHVFSFDACMLAAAGYGVLRVNQRGSIGYSTGHATQIHGNWANDDVLDVTRAVDRAVELGHADPDALGACGVSAGAYLTSWLTSRTARFKAAAVESPCLDWMTMVGGDVGFIFPRWLQAKPGAGAASVERFAGWSPSWHAAACTTPTLIIQHEQDLRTPPGNSDTLFAVLKSTDCTTEMLRLPRTGHTGSIDVGNPIARVAQNEALLEWFDRHLGSATDDR